MELQFDYFHGNEADQFTFYRIPKVLITSPQFKKLSDSAKLLYGLMLDRMSLSIRNGWVDQNNRAFIFFTTKELMNTMGYASEKATKLFAELKNYGLIERIKRGQGKPSVIYVKKFVSPEEKVNVNNRKGCYSQNEISCFEYQNTDFFSQENTEFLKSKSNYTDNNYNNINKTDFNNINPIYHQSGNETELTDGQTMDEFCKKEFVDNNQPTDTGKGTTRVNDNNTVYAENNSQFNKLSVTADMTKNKTAEAVAKENWTEKYNKNLQLVKKQVGYETLILCNNKNLTDNIVGVMAEVMSNDKKTYIIEGVEHCADTVKSQFRKITHDCIETFLLEYARIVERIHNTKKYLITSLFNLPFTAEMTLTNMVNSDMHSFAQRR